MTQTLVHTPVMTGVFSPVSRTVLTNYSWEGRMDTKIDRFLEAILFFGCPGHARRTDYCSHPTLPGRAARGHNRRRDQHREQRIRSRHAADSRSVSGVRPM